MKKKHEQGRVSFDPRKAERIYCVDCGEWLNYGGEYPKEQVCLATVTLATCPACWLDHHCLWIDGKVTIYPARDIEWLYSAGAKVIREI